MSKRLTLKSLYARCERTNGCLLWQGPQNKSGYVSVYDPATYQKAAPRKNGMVAGRVAVWKLTHGGNRPTGRVVMTCRNRACLSAGHMEDVTYAEAAQRAVAEGAYLSLRCRIARVANAHKTRKLTREKVDGIKARVAAGERRQALADEHHVDRSTIDQIMRGARWIEQPMPNCSVFHQAA